MCSILLRNYVLYRHIFLNFGRYFFGTDNCSMGHPNRFELMIRTTCALLCPFVHYNFVIGGFTLAAAAAAAVPINFIPNKTKEILYTTGRIRVPGHKSERTVIKLRCVFSNFSEPARRIYGSFVFGKARFNLSRTDSSQKRKYRRRFVGANCSIVRMCNKLINYELPQSGDARIRFQREIVDVRFLFVFSAWFANGNYR